MLSEKPLHVRKKIALLTTGGIALALLVLMIVLYSTKGDPEGSKRSETTPLRDFYKTISDTTQSFFDGN